MFACERMVAKPGKSGNILNKFWGPIKYKQKYSIKSIIDTIANRFLMFLTYIIGKNNKKSNVETWMKDAKIIKIVNIKPFNLTFLIAK